MQVELANCHLALNDDRRNTVPLYGVTPSEVAVLRVIHGDDAVFEINVTGTTNRTNREERELLTQKYGKSIEGVYRAPAVDSLFPGVAARFFEQFSELDLDDDYFVIDERADVRRKNNAVQDLAPDLTPSEVNTLDEMTKKELVAYAKAKNIPIDATAKKSELLDEIQVAEANAEEAAGASAPEADGDEDDDGIGAMPDQHLFG